MTIRAVLHLDADDVERALSPADAVAVIADTLRDAFDPADDPARSVLPVSRGQLLIMPAEVLGRVGVKVVTVAPENAGAQRPRIQGLFLLFGARHLEPVALIDGAALTRLRTAAVSIAAVRDRLLADREPLDVVAVGAGPQAFAHVRTACDVLSPTRQIASVTYVVRRDPATFPALDDGARYVRAETSEADAALSRAGLVMCATTSAEPLFDAHLLRDSVVVTAVGSHEPDRRELESALLERAQVIVEDVATALREAGDVAIPVGEGRVHPADLIPMSTVVRGDAHLHRNRPVVFKSVGMSWQDLAIAVALERRAGSCAELTGCA